MAVPSRVRDSAARVLVLITVSIIDSSIVSAQAPARAADCNVRNSTVVSSSGVTPGELTLERVVTAAMANHPLVEAARARVEAARGLRQSASAWTNPVVTYWSEKGAFPGQVQPTGVQHEASTYVTVPLEPIFQRPSRERRAGEDVNAAAAALGEARRQVAIDASRAFFRAALAQATVDAAEANQACLERLVALTRTRVSEGAIAEGDFVRADVEFERAATNAVLADVDLVRSRAQLMPFVNDPAAVTAVVRMPATPIQDNDNSDASALPELLARARERRPEAVVARARVAAAEAAIGYERSITVRQLGGTFGVKQIDGQHSMIAAVAMTLPIFDRNKGGVERARGEHLAAQQELAWIERTIAADVMGAHAARQRLVRYLVNMPRSFVDRAEEARTIAIAAYQEGATTLLQVFDASRTLADAQLISTRALLAAEQAAFELALASGDDPVSALNATVSESLRSPLILGQR